MSNTSREIRSEVTSDGQLKLSIESVEMPTPKDHEVLLKVEASPINPSDLGLLISFAADLSSITTEGTGDDKVTTMNILPALHKTMAARFDKSMKVGNEGGGVVVDAGEAGKSLIGKTVGEQVVRCIRNIDVYL